MFMPRYSMYVTWSCFNVTVYFCTYITLTNIHPHTHVHARTHTYITHTRTLINTSMSLCMYSYTRSSLYIHAACWTYPILYYSPEQLTICIFPVLCCLFVLFALFLNVCKKQTICYIQSSNVEEIKLLYWVTSLTVQWLYLSREITVS